MINLLTYPDISYTGVNIVLLNSHSELQQKTSLIVSKLILPSNVTIYDLQINEKQINYNLSALNLADLIIFQNPNLHYWFTGYVLSLLTCYYMEYNSSVLNTLYKVSLRQLTDENIEKVIKDAIQRKYNTTLQLLSETSS